MGNSIVGAIAALVVGAGVAGASIFGLVNSQTGTSGPSPADANDPVVEYGTTNE